MREIPESRRWEESLADFRKKADALPPGKAKDQMEEKVRSLERAIELRDSFTDEIRIHKEHRDGDEQAEGQRPKRRRAKAHAAEDQGDG